MFLLHLSDIHFRSREFGTAQDPHASIRASLVGDIQAEFDKHGTAPERILISGDIAFSGAKAEYDFAAKWIDDLCDLLGLAHEHVFVVPGNHDVDQNVSETVSVSSVRNFIKTNVAINRQETIRRVLSEDQSSEMLYSAINAYNNFSARYSCRLTPPNETVAKEYLDLGRGWKLRLLGLNSALISTRGDTKGHLLVDNASHGITPETGCVTLAMCHHPYGWLRDGDELQDSLNVVAPLQLFGHEHTIRPEIGEDYIRLRSAAVNPSLGEAEWQPGYNILELAVEEEDGKWHLATTAHVRVWQRTPPRFVPLISRQDEPKFVSKILLNNPPTKEMERASQSQLVAVPELIAPVIAQVSDMAQQAPHLTPSIRALTLRFFDLSYSQQSAIVVNLGLNDENDANKPSSVRFSAALRRARDRGQQAALFQAIVEQEVE